MAWVMTGSDDDAAACPLHGYCYLCCGSGCEAYVDYIESHAHEGAADDVLDHVARYACVSAHDNLVGCDIGGAADKGGVCAGELDDVKRVETFACTSAYGAADS